MDKPTSLDLQYQSYFNRIAEEFICKTYAISLYEVKEVIRLILGVAQMNNHIKDDAIGVILIMKKYNYSAIQAFEYLNN